jgi:hypothetical protein
MTTDLWARVRGLFAKPIPPELEQIIAGWRPGQRPGNAVKREVLHPMKGWIEDSTDRAPKT